ncbi:IS66 family insertion sequence element accessory protein TnpB [Escherichia coli]|uniref:IS66 family insertion sequence element accessory protein TnpB n=1 Tax=Escherichia coli TaxID=562 RepID=UPI0009832970
MRHRYLRPALTMPQIYLYRAPIDFRKQVHGLAALVEQQLGHNPFTGALYAFTGTVAKLAMRQPFVLFKGLTFQKLCLPGAFRPGDHHNKMLRPGLCVVHASPQYL